MTKLSAELDRNVCDEYANMNPRARAPYETKAAKDMERYQREVGEL